MLQHNYKDVEHLQSVAAIPQIIENGIFIGSEPNHDIEKNPNVAEYQHFVCGLNIDGEDYTVHSTIAVDKGGNRYYDHNLTHIEKGKLLDLIEKGQAVEIDGFGTTPGTKPTTNIERKIQNLISILQINNKKLAKKIKLATGWERGTDGKPLPDTIIYYSSCLQRQNTPARPPCHPTPLPSASKNLFKSFLIYMPLTPVSPP